MQCQGNLKLIFAVLSAFLCVEVFLWYLLWEENGQHMSIVTINLSFWTTQTSLWRPYTLNYSNGPNDTILHNRIANQLKWTKQLFQSENQDKLPVKNILLIFGNWGREFWGTENKILCPGFSINEEKCKLTISPRGNSLKLNNFDALIYTQDGKRRKLPENVKEFMYETEPPPFSRNKLNAETLWVSYYRGSDIVIPYYKWVAYKDENAENFNPKNDQDNLAITKDFSNEKPNFAVTFVSHCNTESNRSGLVQELQKYVSVDVFGGCGAKPPCSETKRFTCLQSVVKKYKFYLAFEHSNCRDYITEKLFKNAFMNDVLPVVMGGHPDDYLAVAPTNSYIHIEDFQSPKELAEYLIVLDKNDTLYNEYFKWKGTGFFYEPFKDLFCRVCGMMFYYDYFRPRHRWGDNTTWASIDKCLPKGRWYWKLH